MRESLHANRVTSIPIDRLAAHPGCPNRMGKRNFARLVRNIERTGRYEPLVVRRQGDGFQIINGHNRWLALKQLGCQSVDAVVWDLDDAQSPEGLGCAGQKACPAEKAQSQQASP